MKLLNFLECNKKTLLRRKKKTKAHRKGCAEEIKKKKENRWKPRARKKKLKAKTFDINIYRFTPQMTELLNDIILLLQHQSMYLMSKLNVMGQVCMLSHLTIIQRQIYSIKKSSRISWALSVTSNHATSSSDHATWKWRNTRISKNHLSFNFLLRILWKRNKIIKKREPSLINGTIKGIANAGAGRRILSQTTPSRSLNSIAFLQSR